MQRIAIWFAAFISCSVTVPPIASAEILFESGTLGPTGISYGAPSGGPGPGGSGVEPNVFSAVRFELLRPVITTRVGGHFVHDTRTENSFFGAIVELDNEFDFPNSGDLSTPDVAGTAILTFPNPSAEVFGDLEIALDPGWYALVFGSGLFSTTGGGGAILNNPDIGSPSYIAFQTGVGWGNLGPLFRNFRFVVEGNVVPEPASFALSLCVLQCVLLIRIRPRR